MEFFSLAIEFTHKKVHKNVKRVSLVIYVWFLMLPGEQFPFNLMQWIQCEFTVHMYLPKRRNFNEFSFYLIFKVHIFVV